MVTDEEYVSLNQVWYRVFSCSSDGDFLSFTQNGTYYKFTLTDLNKAISFDDQSYPKKVAFMYSNDYVALTQTMLVQNDSYPINISWNISPLQSDISNVTLYITNYFDLQFTFNKAQIPGFMDWINPWDVPSKMHSWNRMGGCYISQIQT